MTPQIRLSSGDVCGMFSVRSHLYSSCDAENSLGNISTEESGTLRSQRGEIDPNTFMKTSIRYLKLLLCVCVCYGGKTAFVCGARSSLCACGHFPKFS